MACASASRTSRRQAGMTVTATATETDARAHARTRAPGRGNARVAGHAPAIALAIALATGTVRRRSRARPRDTRVRARADSNARGARSSAAAAAAAPSPTRPSPTPCWGGMLRTLSCRCRLHRRQSSLPTHQHPLQCRRHRRPHTRRQRCGRQARSLSPHPRPRRRLPGRPSPWTRRLRQHRHCQHQLATSSFNGPRPQTRRASTRPTQATQ